MWSVWLCAIALCVVAETTGTEREEKAYEKRRGTRYKAKREGRVLDGANDVVLYFCTQPVSTKRTDQESELYERGGTCCLFLDELSNFLAVN